MNGKLNNLKSLKKSGEDFLETIRKIILDLEYLKNSLLAIHQVMLH